MSTELILADDIKNKIFTIRGVQVMLDRDLAELYGVETKALNQSVKRNIERFPEEFMFKINNDEKNELVTNCYRLQNLKHSSNNPNVFTEQGVAMLSSVLRSRTAVQTSIQIIKTFVAMRQFLSYNADIFKRITNLEMNQIALLNKQNTNDLQINQILNAIESKKLTPTQGIFFDGQIFDAYKFVSDLIRRAKNTITLLDNYIDDNTLTILSKKEEHIKVTILTKQISKQLKLDITKANEQYGNFEIKEFSKSHDRFLIIDDAEIYHLGASLKDLGKKWFAFSKMEMPVLELLGRM